MPYASGVSDHSVKMISFVGPDRIKIKIGIVNFDEFLTSIKALKEGGRKSFSVIENNGERIVEVEIVNDGERVRILWS